MALVLNEEQRLLKDTAREFLSARAPVDALRKLRDDRNPVGYDEGLWAEMAELGWAGIVLPEEYGGLDFGFVGLGGVIEECGRNLTASPLLASVILGASAILLGGSEQRKASALPDIASGQLHLPPADAAD
jgi:acyl-CoA dehydrogenase